ncbi:MAG: trimethylamine methyltransferase family protein [Candidatus Kariarchaeaceae archaeon]|jgi:trimethylamine--corrinoid protein Co-methyltransferase
MQETILKSFPSEFLKVFHEKVVWLIENAGIQIDHAGMLSRLSDFDGVKINNNMVTFRSDLVDKHVFNIQFDMPDYFNEENFVLISGNMNPTIKDWKTGKIRLATKDDLLKATKLEDSLDVTGTAAVSLSDVPKHLVEITMHKILWEHSRFKGNDIFEHNSKSTIQCCKYIHEIAQVLNKRFTVGLWFESPRRFNKYELQVVYEYLDQDVPLWVGSFPMYGVTSPIFIESSMVQSAAELFSGFLMLKLLHANYQVYVQVIDSIMGHPVNWMFTNVTFTSIEDIMKTIYQKYINAYYNIPLVGMSLLSGGKGEDCQQGFEKGIHTLIAALLGARAFRLGGMIAQDMVYSPEQLVIDFEMLQFIKQLTRKKYFDPDKILVDEIMKVKPGESFINTQLTLDHFKEEYHHFDLFDSAPVGYWLEKGALSLEKRAHHIVEERAAKHEYHISPEKQEEIDTIYNIAARDSVLVESYRGR